jgi:glucoamylase
VTAGTYASSSSTYTTLTSAIKTYADGFVEVVQSYTPSNGGLSEQFDKASGVPLSAADLTWSYASALTAFDARAGHVPDSSGWGAAGLSLGSCAGGSGGATEQITFNEAATTVWGGARSSILSL